MRYEVKRPTVLTVLLAAFVLALAGCAGGGGKATTSVQTKALMSYPQSSVRSPLVVAGSRKVARVNLRNGARFLSPTRLAIVTQGSTTCPAVPNRLVAQTPETIRIHLAMGSWRGKVPVAHLPPSGACTADVATALIVVRINPKQINIHQQLTIRLYYYSIKRPIIRTVPAL